MRREITHELKARLMVIDSTVKTLEYTRSSFSRSKEVKSDIDNIHMEHQIAREYKSILMEVYPGADTLYEDDIIYAIGQIGLHYTYLTGKVMYVTTIHGHRLYMLKGK